MTPKQQIEWQYRFDERLGILCEGKPPTIMQEVIARTEADAWRFEDQCVNGEGGF